MSDWQNEAGKRYRYCMVFRDTDAPIDGAANMTDFLDIVTKPPLK